MLLQSFENERQGFIARNIGRKLFFFFLSNIYLVTTLLMTILTVTWRKNKNNVQVIKEKYNVTAFTTKGNFTDLFNNMLCIVYF